MIVVALSILVVSMIVVLVRAIAGPTAQDRMLSANTFGATIVLWLCTWAVFSRELFVIDIAMVYALTSFVATVAALRFFKGRGFRSGIVERSLTWPRREETR